MYMRTIYVMELQPWRRTVLRRAAVRYSEHGWPVVPGAFLAGGRFTCGPLCPTVGCHPAVDDWESDAPYQPDELRDWWSAAPFSVLLATGVAFDVIEVPASLGATVAPAGRTGPVAVAPTGQWMFLVEPGDGLRPELAARLDVVLHGRGSWIPAPPTQTPLGRVRWEVAPDAARWRFPSTYQVQEALTVPLAGSPRSLRTAA
jgi:hypothetical protein